MKLVVVALLLIGSLCFAEGKPKIPWWQIKVTKAQGPNVCIVEEIPELGKKYYTECKYWPQRKVCGRDTVVRYECCEGYKQRAGEEGCTGVKQLKNVLETARELGANKFVSYLQRSGIAYQLREQGTFTLFAPIDSAFVGYYGSSVAQKIETYLGSGYNPILYYHVSERKMGSKDFSGNTEINSMHENRTLRISKYSTGMETVNCVLISRKDQEASNGIVHMIDAPLDPTLWIQTDVVRVISEDGRFTKLSQAIQRCSFASRLREIGKTYTVLAPSDEAFLKIPPTRLNELLNDRRSCVALLENHVIPHVMCTPVLTEEHKARTIAPNNGRVEFDCDEKGHSVDGKKLSGEFILGHNGIVYMLDDVLFPDRARTLLELADNRGLSTLVHLMKVAGLDGKFDSFGDYTLFAPTDEAFLELDEELVEEARYNPDLARKLILYHATEGRILTSTIKNNQNQMSLDSENPLRLVVYRKGYGVEDAMIETSDLECMNGVMHIVDKVLFPATQSAGDILRKSANYSMFLEAMEKVMVTDPLAVPLRRSQENSHYTFFVPTDDAFRTLGAARLRRMQSDNTYLAKVIKNHVSSSMMASTAFKSDLTYDVPTRQNAIGVCNRNGKIKVNDQANVVKKDITSSNGIIHVIDKVMLPDYDY